MYNKKILIDALKKLGNAKAPTQKKDVIVGSTNAMPMPTMKKGGTSADKRLSVKKSNIQGRGLFINEPIKKGEVIGLAHVNNQATPMVGKYHNHSEDNPTAVNISQGNKRYLVAARDLPAGTEITTNYRLQPELEQPEDFMQKGGMTPQKDGYRTYSPFKHLPFIDVESDTIDTDNIIYDLQLVGNNGVIKNVEKNSGLHRIPGASVIREIPMGRKGGSAPKLPGKKNSRAYSRSLDATNRLFAEHPWFKKSKSRKNKIYDPNARYYQPGGETGCPEGYAFNPKTGECIEWNPTVWNTEDESTSFDPVADIIYMNPNDRPDGMSDQEYNQMYQDQLEHEQLHRLQWLNDELQGESKIPLRMPSSVDNQKYDGPHYYNRRQEEADYLHNYWKSMYPENAQFIPDDVIYNKETDPAMYQLPWTVEGEARDYEYATHDGMPSFFPKRKKGGALTKAQKGLSYNQRMQAYDDSLALYNSYNQFMNVLKNPQYKLQSAALNRYQGRNLGFGPTQLSRNLYQNIKPVNVFTYYQGNQPWRVAKYKKPVMPQKQPNNFGVIINKTKPCVPKTTVINNVPDKPPFGKRLVGTTENTTPVSSTNSCEYIKVIEPIYEDAFGTTEPIKINPPSLVHGQLPELKQASNILPEESVEAPQYTLDPYTDERLRLVIEPGKSKKKIHRGRLMDGKGQRYKWTTYKQTKDLEFHRKEVTRPIAALVQKLTGYDPKYFEGYYDEEGAEEGDEIKFVPGELDYGNATGSKMEFKGAASLRDLMNQKKYEKEYEEYEKKLDEWHEKYEQSKKKQAEGRAFKYGGLFKFLDGGENSCDPFYKWDSTLNKCVPFTEEEKANYSLQYMKDWTKSPMHKEMLTASVKKDAPLGDINKYVDNITNLRLKALNPNLKIEDIDPKQKGVIGEADPLIFNPYINNDPVTIQNGNKETINPKVATEDDIKNYNTFRSPLYYSQLNNAKFKDKNFENFTKDFKADVTFYTKNRPGEHAYVYPHEYSHLSDFGGELIPISDRKLIKEWESHYPEYSSAYDQYVFKGAKPLYDQYNKKIITKDELTEKLENLQTDWYLNNKDKRYYSDKEMYENNFNKFKKQGDYNDDTLTNDLPYDDFIKKNKINFDPVDYKRYVGTNTEVRSRINAARMFAKAAGIYDPFTERLTPEKYKELNKLFENQNPNEKDANQLRQLKHLYDDDEILNLMNTLSKNDSQIENDIQHSKKGGALPRAQLGLTGLGDRPGIYLTPFDLKTQSGQITDFHKNPNYSLTYTVPKLFKKAELAGNPLSFTIGRPYYTDTQRLTNPALDYDPIFRQDYHSNPVQQLQYGPNYQQYLQDVSDYTGTPVSNLNQTKVNQYNAAQNLAAVKPKYNKPGAPVTANLQYSVFGNLPGKSSAGPLTGALTLGAGYAPEPGFYGNVDFNAYGVFGKRKNKSMSPKTYFERGLTRKKDRAWIPGLDIMDFSIRQRSPYNDAQTQKILELYKEDIQNGTTTAENFITNKADQSSSMPFSISALSPSLTYQRYFEPLGLPVIFSATAGLRNTIEGKDKTKTTVGGQWTTRPYGNVRLVVPMDRAIDRLKDLDLPSVKNRRSYYDYVNENEQTDDTNEPPTDNTFPPEDTDTSTDGNTIQPSYDGKGVGKGPCPNGYERLCEECRCTKIKSRRSPLLDKRGIHPYIDGQYLQNGGEADAMNAMMKARLAYANEFGNPAAQRMVVAPDNPYDFGNGMIGTHYMSSMDNWAVPQIQNKNGQLVLGDYGPFSTEAIRFDRPEDAEYFAEHYKDVSPAFIETKLTPEEIDEYAKGGYIIEDISIPSLTRMDNGGAIDCPEGYAKDPYTNDCIPETTKKEVVTSHYPQWKKDRDKYGKDEISWYESWNPKKWGLNDYSDYSSFNSAFRNARESDESEFVWNGNRYSTELIPQAESDLYWESKDFINQYYNTQPYKKSDSYDYGLTENTNKYFKKKYNTTFSELYNKQQKIKEKLGEKAYNNKEYIDLDTRMSKILDEEIAINNKTNQEYNSWYNANVINKAKKERLQSLNKPSYFSITSQKGNLEEDGSWNEKENKMFTTTAKGKNSDEWDKLNTTYIHELSHKADDILDVLDTYPKIDIAKLNASPLGKTMSQETFNYLDDPSEIEARKLSTLFYLYKNKRNWKTGTITSQDLNNLYDDYYDDKLPYDIKQLLELYDGQYEDLLEYLNSTYNYKKKMGGNSVPSLNKMKKGGLPCPPFCSPLIELSKGFSSIAKNVPKTNFLGRGIANTATIADEALGQAFLAKQNQAAISAGNKWLHNWIQHPTTQMKMQADMLDVINNKNLNPHALKYETPRYGDIVLNPEDQYIGALEIAKNYMPDTQPYSFENFFSNLKEDKLNPMIDMAGINFRHQSDPIRRDLFRTGYFKPNSTQIDTEYIPFKHYGSFVSRSPRFSPYKKELTVIHEGTHDWITDKLLKETGQKDLILGGIDPEIKKLWEKWSANRETNDLTKDEKTLAYLANPTEVHARIMELRRHNNLTPSDYVDEDMAKQFFKQIENGEIGINKNFGKVLKNDPKILSKLMNDLYGIAIPLGVGVGGASLLKNPYKEESPIGGYKMGGEFELGDEVDEATMKELKKLGFTFEKI